MAEPALLEPGLRVEAATRGRRALRIPRDFPAFAIALAFAATAISLLPTAPNDLWWHMRVGQVIAESGRVPTTDLFAWTLPTGTPYVYGTWLGELLLYRLYQIGGVELVVFARNVLAAALLGLVGIETHRRIGSWRLASLAVIAAGLLLLTSANVRPQMFAWVPFGLLLLVLGSYADGRLRAHWMLLTTAALMVLWVNVHGSFILGPLIVGAFLVGEILQRSRGRLVWLHGLRARPTSGSVAKPEYDGAQLPAPHRVGEFALALAVALAATLANPRGIGIYAYVASLLRDVPTQRLIGEWRPPTPHSLVEGWFFVTALLFLAVWARAPRRPAARDVLLVCGFLWMAWHGVRYVLWYGVVAMPLLVESAASLGRRRATLATLSPWVGGVVAGALVIPFALVQPWFGRVHPLVVHTPVAAVDYLRANPGGRLFNNLTFGSYLIWALPEQPVFIDPRIELYPEQLTRDYLSASDGRDALNILDRYGADRVLLNLEQQPELRRALGNSSDWEREYADDQAEIWQRRDRGRGPVDTIRPTRMIPELGERRRDRGDPRPVGRHAARDRAVPGQRRSRERRNR